MFIAVCAQPVAALQIKRRGSKTSTGSTASTPEICITPPEDDDDDDDDEDDAAVAAEAETHLIITTQPIKKLEFHTERFSLPTIPPPKLTLIDPRKGDRQLSILDNAIDEEDELLLSVENSTTLPEETETVTGESLHDVLRFASIPPSVILGRSFCSFSTPLSLFLLLTSILKPLSFQVVLAGARRFSLPLVVVDCFPHFQAKPGSH